MSRSIRTLCLAHLLGNALLLGLGYYWLGLGEESAGVLLWSLLVAATVALGACWLHGAAFAMWAAPTDRPFRLALRNLAPIAAAALAATALYLFVSLRVGQSAQPAFRFASWLTLTLRRPVKPSTVLAVFNVEWWILRWMVLPVMLLPRFARVVAYGWRGLGRFLGSTGESACPLQPCGAGASACQPSLSRALGERLVCLFHDRLVARLLVTPVLLLCAFRLPFLLMGWVPPVGGFWLEMLSFAMRCAIAYLLFVGSWLLLVFLTSSGKPAATQPKTAVSP